MEPVLERLPTGGRVAVVRLRSLGDCVLTTPALRILKQHRHDLRVAVVVEPRFAAIFEDNPDVDRILPPTVPAVGAWSPDLTINFHGGTRSVVLTLASRARIRAGFGHYRARWAYNVVLPRAQQVLGAERTVHTAQHLASAIFHLGAPVCDIPRARLFAAPWPHSRPYAVLHPFASAAEKAWPAERFAALARQLPMEPVILAGPTDDATVFNGLRVVRASLSDVKSLLASASLFIGNDSGPAHMAAALGVPVTVLYGPSNPVVWAPWKPVAAEVLIRPAMADISIDEVQAAVERLKAPV